MNSPLPVLKTRIWMLVLAGFLALLVWPARADDQWVVYEGKSGPGKGKHIVFLTGDEEYRSEEGMPMMAKLLAEHHGFKCTVLFSIKKETGEIDCVTKTNEPGMAALDSADLCVMLLRFRAWPDEQMKHFADYYLSGKPIIALRTSTHAFNYETNLAGPYAKYTYTGKVWPGGFGKQVLGETWVTHWGKHRSEATHGVFEQSARDNPILRGVEDIFVTTDVYETWPPADATVLVRGQVLSGMKPDTAPATYVKKNAKGLEQPVNDPMMPTVWTREYKNEAGKTNKILTTTMGAATDLENEGLRRLLVNAAYWAVGLEKQIPAKSNADIVGEYHPTFYGFNAGKKGVKPADLK